MTYGRFLFVTWGGGGNVPPALGLAAKLVERGHEVRFLAAGELEGRVADAGFPFRAFARVRPPAAELSFEDQTADFVRVLTSEEGARDILFEIERQPTDVLIVDCMQLNALTAAEMSGRPTAVFVHLLYEPWRMRPGFGEMVRSFVDETRSRLGIPPLTEDLVLAQLWDTHAVALVVTPREFDFPNPSLPANVRYVGPIFEPAAARPELPWSSDDAAPLVLVSFSSTYMHQEDALRRTAEAVASTGARCLVTVGEAIDPATVPADERIVVRQWIPHSAVLPDTSVVVTHAGHATVMAALAHGVPLVCMPMGRDQQQNAQRVTDLGAGRTISMDASPAEIRDAVRDVVDDVSYRRAAAGLAETIAKYDNGARAVGELETLL